MTVRHAFGLLILLAIVAGARRAEAQVTDQATCSSSLPACTTTRLNCCTRDFTGTPAKAIMIPLDRCHQVIANGSDGPPGTDGASPHWCADSPAPSTNSMFYAYGLVYRLMQAGIPVYWVVNPSKRPTTVSSTNATETTKDVDFWVLAKNADPPAPGASLTGLVGTAPVQLLGTDASLNLKVVSSYSKNEFPVRGGAFFIAPQDRAAFETFWRKRSNRTGCGASNGDCYDFRDVYLYQVDASAHFAWQDFTQPLVGGKYVKRDNELPIAMNIDYAPPRIARFYSGQTLSNWLKAANLDDPATNTSCRQGAAFVPSDAIGCDLLESDVQAGSLVTGKFSWAWIDASPSSTCSATMTEIKRFMTAVADQYTAGNVMFSNSGIQLAEQCGTNQVLGKPGVGLALATGAVNEGQGKPPFIARYANNLFAQYGDFALDFASGSVGSWTRWSASTGNLYSSVFDTTPVSLRRLFTNENPSNTGANPFCVGHDATSVASCDDGTNSATADMVDIFAYARYNNVKANGVVFYSPGANVTQSSQRAQLRMILSSLIATPPFTVEQVVSKTEVSRASPVVATIGTSPAIVQGTYEYTYVTKAGIQYPVPRTVPGVYTRDDLLQFTFPAQRGHLRAVPTSTISTTATAFGSGTSLFDAADGIPTVSFTGCTTPFTASCRTVWTTVDGGLRPSRVFVHEGNVTTLGPLMLPNYTQADQKLLIDRILKGYDNGSGYVSALGGIDRSTVAVIGPGASVGATRPTIAYVGASDGMLHAICASVGGACDVLGRELWAYVPRVHLGTLRYNAAKLDGSPRVLDVRGDFTGSGSKSLRTVLLFQTGSGDPSGSTVTGATPAVYALDVTDPTKPSVLWEYTTPATRGSYELGVGLTIAAGDALVGDVKKNLAVIQTNNGGTAGAGNVVIALDLETGKPLWKLGYTYPTPRTASNLAVPASGIPGGAVGVDKTTAGGNGFMTDIVFADLYGQLWEIDPKDGSSRYKSSQGNGIPLFTFSTDYHPIGAKPAIYANGGKQYAVFTSGGYADPTLTPGWGTYTNAHQLIAVALDTPATGGPALPLTENSSTAYAPIKVNLGAGERGFSQARVVGNELLVTTETAIVNSTTYGTSEAATGRVYRINFATGTQSSTVVVASGSTQLANDGAKLYASAGATRQQLMTDAAGTVGPAVTAANQTTKLLRKLWLLTQ
ncbi:MAG TPA: hypothetical protein VFQ53_29165 [Kofleriaceae bacterium]|nr:hypothetical protein [Kofleriaceae bacterium]